MSKTAEDVMTKGQEVKERTSGSPTCLAHGST